MFVKLIRNACLAAAVSLGAIGAAAAPAAANGFSVGVTIGNGPVAIDYRDRGRGHGRGYGRDVRGRGHAAYGCDLRRAVHKASRIGMRHARVVRANPRAVAVAGRLNGDRAIIRFANRHNCPVAGIRGR
ncbi:hypothetical protein U0C82_08585 [Fulvimarina sp. 2208YS6-2-32]|uniref:Antifreeze protein n=1 Tax=Fulvimarina uroteuthidis TaxID=3098149 RepID=A0ABU5I1E3_9HYPH|nr:hypothetical protein [Fulvimarina sp. 2208YS6-2-32]MDY8109199.1 hypothetical protein [Fulvimarina sp. 2208YS6-2-32]